MAGKFTFTQNQLDYPQITLRKVMFLIIIFEILIISSIDYWYFPFSSIQYGETFTLIPKYEYGQIHISLREI